VRGLAIVARLTLRGALKISLLILVVNKK